MLPGNLKVLRKIPTEAIRGLLTKELVLDGGVIRWASGTNRGGQIFMHLVSASKIAHNIIPNFNLIPAVNLIKNIFDGNRLNKIEQSNQQILSTVRNINALAGLSIAISTISFKIINNKLNHINKNIEDLKSLTEEVKELIEIIEQAKLGNALEELTKIERLNNSENRREILIHSRKELAQIYHRYKIEFQNTNDLIKLLLFEEYLTLSALARAQCSAELGELKIAAEELEDFYSFWLHQARKIALENLIGKYPQRFFATDFVDIVTVNDIVNWLDFVNNDNKEYLWVDEIRLVMNEYWYKSSENNINGKNFKDKFQYLLDEFWRGRDQVRGLNKNEGVGLEQEKNLIIPSLQKLYARNKILRGYCSQYNFFEENNIKPSAFQELLYQLPKKYIVNNYFLLQVTN
jgi:hypothetical protein